jgi:rubrerythrin
MKAGRPMFPSQKEPRHTAVKRNFTSLSPQEALRIAIVIEERNAHIYQRLGEVFSKCCPDSPQIPSAFYDLANEERQHGILLTERYFERFGAVHADITEEDIWDFIEVPRLAVADILAAVEAGDALAARRMAFEMALAAEQGAVNYYARVAKTTPDPELKALCEEFVAMEREHTDWVEQALGQPGPHLNPVAPTQKE